MTKRTAIALILFVALVILHQDNWNWDNRNLVFGFLPVGLAYHAGYSIVAALFWLAVNRFAWPERIERWAEEEEGVEDQTLS